MTTTPILLVILFFLMALFYCVQKGFNQVITGLNAIHEQLRRMNDSKEKDSA